MTFIKLQGFSGVVPRTSPTLLSNNQAQIASNVKLQSGELRSWRQPTLAYTPAITDCSSIYKLVGPGGLTKWLTWAGDVDVVSGPVPDSADFRIYYTSSSFSPRKTNWVKATTSNTGVAPYPNAYQEMGLPNPVGAPTLVPSGGTAPSETRAYVYTYINNFGAVVEESAPSPASTVTCNSSGATVVVSGFSPPPAGNYTWAGVRIYRSVTGSSSTNYQFVAQIALGVTTYSDTLPVLSLGVTLPSLYYTPPPIDMQGIVAMPNGMLAGFRNNEVWFCEPYLPHAWPSTYVLTTEFPIVGLGVYDSTLVVTTTKNPYLISGSNPGVMTQTKLALSQPCVSKRSIAYDQNGVVYASPNGLVAIAAGVQQVITEKLYTRDEWQVLLPALMLGVIYNNMYVGFHPNGTSINSIVLTQSDQPPLVSLNFDATGVFVERATGNIFGVSQADNKIYQLDSDKVNNIVYEWWSKKFILSAPTNFGALKVQADFTYMADLVAYNAQVEALTVANNILFNSLSGQSLGGALGTSYIGETVMDGSLLATLPNKGSSRTITLIIYADGVQVFSTNIINQEPVRMPAGFKAYVWEIRIVGNTPVRSFAMANTIEELRGVTQA